MTVLKGQAASALYGTRASNGVILITTKKGKKGDATIDFNTNNVVDKAINYTDYQYVYGQGVNGTKPTTATNALNTDRLAWGSKMDGSTVIGYDGKTYTYSPYKNNISDFYRTGATFTNTVSVSSGGEKGTFRFSASNLDNNAIVRNSGINRKTFNLNLDQKVTDKLSVSVMGNYIDEEDKNRQQLSDGPGNANNFLFLAPNLNVAMFQPGYDANGNEVVFSDDNYVTNPWFVVNKWVTNTSRKRLISAVSAKYALNDWIYGLVRLGYDNSNDRILSVTPSGTNYSINSAGQSGSISINDITTTEMNIDGLLGVKHKITTDLSFDATLGGTIRKYKDETVGVNGGPFIIPGLYTPTNVLNYGRSYAYHQKEVHSGFYTVDLSYKNYLTLNTTGRYDAYSTLYNSGISKDQRNIFTPSVSASFNFSELVHIPSLDLGKLRASYAQTSGEPGTPYQTATYYGVGSAINGVATGNFSSTLPNLFLKPFTLSEFEVGTELKFLHNRLGFDIAYFTRKTKNEIFSSGLSQSTGYSGTVIASGATQNRGLEVLVTGAPVKTKQFSWNVSVNFTSVSNKILQTNAAGNNSNLGNYRPLNANTAFVKGMAGPQILAHDYTYDAKGNIMVDASGLPISGALAPMGSVLPTLYGGLKNDFTFGNFNLSFLIDYNFGNKILSATSYYSIYRGLNKMTLAGRETGITVAGVNPSGGANTVVAAAQDYYQRLASISRVNVLSGDFIKLRQVALGYTISEKMLGKIPVIRSIQLSLVARNLLVLMKHSDNIDPEAEFASSVAYAGIEGTSLPSTRTFGINASFKFK
jgi:TonB-linked SusC/RagA family outer membrane protein